MTKERSSRPTSQRKIKQEGLEKMPRVPAMADEPQERKIRVIPKKFVMSSITEGSSHESSSGEGEVVADIASVNIGETFANSSTTMSRERVNRALTLIRTLSSINYKIRSSSGVIDVQTYK